MGGGSQNLVLRMTLDSICKVAFGVELGCISPSLPDMPFAMAFDEAQWLIARRMVNPFFKIERALNIGSERRFRKAITVVNEFAYDVIRKRRMEIDVAHKAGKEFVSPTSFHQTINLNLQRPKQLDQSNHLSPIVAPTPKSHRTTYSLSSICF